MSVGISILIISFEAKNVKTEEIYFVNRESENLPSFSKDTFFLQSLNIKHVFFKSIRINASKEKVEIALDRWKWQKLKISKVFLICDKDSLSFSPDQLKRKSEFFQKVVGDFFEDAEVHYLEYTNENDNFETFLGFHQSSGKLCEGYKKTDSRIYEKYMGRDGKNYDILKKNIKKFGKLEKFLLLFREHSSQDFD